MASTLYEISQAFRRIGEQETRKLGVVAAANKTYSLKEVEELLTNIILTKKKPTPSISEERNVWEKTRDSKFGDCQLNEDLFG